MSLLSQADITSKTGILWKHFQTFSEFNTLIVHKEPLQTITDISGEVYPGYEGEHNLTNITYTPISGSFPVMVVNDKDATQAQLSETNNTFPTNRIRVKTTEAARLFIKSGKNELFELNGLQYNELGQETIQNYLGLKFYYFTLTSTT